MSRAKQAALKAIRAFGLSLTKLTPTAEVKSFIKTLTPKNSGHRLIRIGGDADGGYLLPDALEHIAACFSPGVAETADFELEIASRGIPCFLADYSVSKCPNDHPLLHFEKRFIGNHSDDQFIRLEDWVKRLSPGRGDLILQMDIEGHEYDVLCDTSRDLLRRFRVIVIEFHDLHRIWEPGFMRLVENAFFKLLDDFTVVHIHPNNCCDPLSHDGVDVPPVMEFTFLRNDQISKISPNTCFPHSLDRPNVKRRQDLPLPICWYESSETK